MDSAISDPSELIMDTMNNLQLESQLQSYMASLSLIGSSDMANQSVSVSYENEKILNNEVLMIGKTIKATYYGLMEKQLVVSITLIGICLFSTTLMFMVLRFPKYAWILSLIISGAAIAGIFIAIYGVQTSSIIDGKNFSQKSNTDPLDATLSVTMPFLIFSAILVVIAVVATVIIWYSSTKDALAPGMSETR